MNINNLSKLASDRMALVALKMTLTIKNWRSATALDAMVAFNALHLVKRWMNLFLTEEGDDNQHLLRVALQPDLIVNKGVL